MLGVVVVATAVAALVARNLYHQQPAAGPPPVVSTTESSVAPAAEPGSTVVAMTPDVAANSQGRQVQQVLQTYFDAINNRDYDKLLSVVTAQFAAAQPKQRFLSAYKTTSDGTIRVMRIDQAPSGLSVMITFHSMQDLADAPAFAKFKCIQWQEVLPMVRQGDSFELDNAPTGASPQTQQCA